MASPDNRISNVALDATLWDEPTTGIGLYTHCLARSLQRLGVAVDRVGARKSGEAPRGRWGRTAFTVGLLPNLLLEQPAPIFHAVNNFNLPLLRVRGKALVLTVHDLIPLMFPDTVSRGFRLQFQLWLARSLRIADQVICVSETSRRDLLSRFRFDERRIRVVHNGVDHLADIDAPDAIGRAYLDALALPERFILYAGSLDARKNVSLVLDACERLWVRGKRVCLVLMGQAWFGSGSAERRIAKLRGEGRDLRSLGFQPEAIFYEVMRRASVFVFPSRYEGFGLPPLEAMWQGVPTITSNVGALPEVIGDAALQVPPDDSESLAERIEQLLGSAEERETWRGRGAERARAFTWARTATETLAAYSAALDR